MMDRKRRFTWLVAALIVCAIAIFAYQWLRPSGAKIVVGNCEKIRKGMTVQDVEAILGVGPGDYSGAEKWWKGIVKASMKTWNGNPPSLIWLGEEVSIGIWLDQAGLVAHMTWLKHAFQGKRLFERIKQSLGL